MVTLYISVVRLVFEYACPVMHTNLPQYLSHNMEMIQIKAMKMYVSWMGLRLDSQHYPIQDALTVRRDSLCEQYFDKIKVGTHSIHCLLPDKRYCQ